MKTIATLFSGGCLFDVGARQAGYKHLWGIEKDEKIAEVARLNGFHIVSGDVRTINLEELKLEAPDHLHASPPCPSFSVAKNGGGETALDIELAEAVCQFITIFRPSTFSMENVTAYKKSKSFKQIITCLESLGYMIDVQVLNAADFGVPQTRRRLIVRAMKGLLRPYPNPVPWIGWYQAVEDLIPSLPDSEFAEWQIKRLPQEYVNLLTQPTSYNPETTRGKIYRNEHESAPTILVKNSSMKAFVAAGGSAGKNMPIKDPKDPIFTIKANAGGREPVRAWVANTKEPHGKDGVFTVREEEEPIYTLLNSAGEYRHMAQVHGRVVKMTTQALGRFQTVPDSYVGLTSKINGNGVPCLLAQRIMETFGV